MTDLEIDALVKAIGPVIHEHVESVIAPLVDRLATLETRGLKYCGVWQRAQTYRRGEVVTHEGSAWIAVEGNEAFEPGKGSMWQLMVKAGRNGKDAS